jgi:predicted transcriptional regulator
MRQVALFLSVKPIFANGILDGTKTVELRRVCPNVASGDMVLIYSTSPEMALLGSAQVAQVLSGAPLHIWKEVREHACVTREQFDSYFSGATTASGIWLCAVRRLARPIHLRELRERWPWLKPPQSYRYVDAWLDPGRDIINFLRPAGSSA